jgi:hypothetical protein
MKTRRNNNKFSNNRSKKNVQKGRGGTKSDNSRKITLSYTSFTPPKPRIPPDYTKYGAFPGTKAYREQSIKDKIKPRKSKKK